MRKTMEIVMNDQELLEFCREYFKYDGNYLFWKKKRQGCRIGSIAGCVASRGYRLIMINGKNHSAHKLIYFMHTEEYPEVIDHIDRDTSNNSLDNLRACTSSQNNCNRRALGNKKIKGVYKSKTKGKWYSCIKPTGMKSINLGSFDDIRDATIAYNKAALKYHGEFAYINEVPNA